jgi:hypothetical protein
MRWPIAAQGAQLAVPSATTATAGAQAPAKGGERGDLVGWARGVVSPARRS